MIIPSAVDCLRTIERTLEDKIRPALTGTLERSTLATVGHLLRHVACRIEREGEVLTDDIATLRALLAELRDYAAPDGAGLAGEIDAALARRFRADGAYPGLASLAEEAGALRETLTTAQRWLIGLGPARDADPSYQAMREKIRGYIAHQLEAEAELIEPAFLGHGPRR